VPDDIELNAGSGGDVVGADLIGTTKYQRIKLIHGSDGVNDGDVSSANPLPVTDTATKVDDAAFTPATSRVMVIGAVFDDVAPDSVNEGDAGAPRMSANRNLYTTIRDAAGNERGLNVDANGAIAVTDGSSTLSVDDGAGSLTVDNAALAVTGGGVEASALRVTIASDSTGVLSVDDNGSTLSIDDGGGSLTVDNAGTFAVQVDGAALTALQLIDNLVLAEDAAHVTADPGVQALAVRKATPANLSGADGDYEPLQMSGGRLWTSAVIDTALPAGTNAIGKLAANSGVDIGDVDVTSVTPGTAASSLGKAEDAAHSSGDVGVMALAVRAASPTERSAGPTDGDYEPLAVNEVGAVWVTQTPSANGGCSIYSTLDLDETEEEVKASAGTVYGVWATNTATSTRWLKFYNATAASVVVGTTTPVITIGIPGNSSDDISGNFAPGIGIKFDTAICIAATTGFAVADTGAPAANDVICNVFYR
jgi:hypothetical protein